MNEAVKLLVDIAGYTEREASEKFRIEETDKQWTIKAIGYLDAKTWKTILEAVSDRGGGYTKDESTKFAIFTIPKVSGSQISHVEEVASMEKNIPEEGDYALSRSMKGKLGQLVPCLKDGEDIVIDGFHRLKVNPNAWTVKLDHIKTPVDRAMARMTVNFCRRHYTSEEMTNDIGLLIGAGYTVQQIAETTGISERTIYSYMPQQLKDQKLSEAQKKGWEEKKEKEFARLQTTLKTQETPKGIIEQPQKMNGTQVYQKYLGGTRECEQCGQQSPRQSMHFVNNKLVCPQCAGKTERPPITKPEPPQKPYKEKPEQRRAVMQPQKSKFELAVIQELQTEGYQIETDREFCLVKTIPDGILHRKAGKPLAIYIDSVETHPEGNETDDFCRTKLKKFYGFDICEVRYESDTKEERQHAKDKIKEFLKW